MTQQFWRGALTLEQTLSDVYGDLLDFCRQTRRIFADNKGQPRSMHHLKLSRQLYVLILISLSKNIYPL